MMKKQAFNPYLPSYEYVPDGEPHVVDGRVYIYGSHDLFNGLNFCLGDYVCWSAPVDDLGSWRYEGCIYKREQDPAAPRIRLTNGLAAPDMVQGDDGRYYLYYFMGGTKMISVAVCDEPAGKYEFYGYVKYADQTPIGKKGEPFQFDPGIFRDDDGRLYLYTGFALTGNPILLDGSKPTEHGPMCFEIDPSDMLTVKSGPEYIGGAGEKESVGTPYEGHAFLEASSMRKFGDTYYFIYSSLNSHELCYATSDNPTCGFEYGGPLKGQGTYPAYIACNLYGRDGTMFLSMLKHRKKGYPYITQDGGDREEGPDQYIANMCDGAVAGFKYFDLADTTDIRINIRGNADGTVTVKDGDGPDARVLSEIRVSEAGSGKGFAGKLSNTGNNQALFFSFKGKRAFKFLSFDLKQTKE